MILIICIILSFIFGYKLSQAYSILKIAYLKKEISIDDMRKEVEKQYKQEINKLNKKIKSLENTIDKLNNSYVDEEEEEE